MNRKLRVLSILTALVLLGFTYDARNTEPTAPAQSDITSSRSAGLVLNIDPVTGAIIDEPVAGATKLSIPASLAGRWSTSDEGLIEQPNPSGGKGVYVNLQGRFENGMVGSIDANGALNAPCAQGLNSDANLTASEK
jgi:hypothetical protein